MKKTFSQLKRDLQKGTKVKTILNNIKPEKNGEVRTINIVQTNAITFLTNEGKNSWLMWEKASNYEYEDNIFKCYSTPNEYNNFTRELYFVYEILR